jgi:predicted dehydrogenase
MSESTLQNDQTTLNITISGTGFAGDFVARCFGMLPHRNGVNIRLAGVNSGHLGNAEKFARKHNVADAFDSHADMLAAVKPGIDCIACANYAHGQYVKEAAEAGVKVVVLEKPPVIWPGYPEGREAPAETRKTESMAALEEVLEAVAASGTKLLYAENFVYVDGMKSLVELMHEAQATGKGKVLLQQGVCAHQGSHAPDYDTPAKSGGGSLFNKACHPLGSALYLKQVEGMLRAGKPIRPARVSAVALQVLKEQGKDAGEHFRVMQNVDDFARITVVFDDGTVAELYGYDLSISGIRNSYSVITDFAQYDMRINPNDGNELFLPNPKTIGDVLLREKLPTAEGTSFPSPQQFHAHGYVNEIDDAVACALDARRYPQSGPLLAWDTMAILMAGYESTENNSAFVDITEYSGKNIVGDTALPDPRHLGAVLGRG